MGWYSFLRMCSLFTVSQIRTWTTTLINYLVISYTIRFLRRISATDLFSHSLSFSFATNTLRLFQSIWLFQNIWFLKQTIRMESLHIHADLAGLVRWSDVEPARRVFGHVHLARVLNITHELDAAWALRKNLCRRYKLCYYNFKWNKIVSIKLLNH